MDAYQVLKVAMEAIANNDIERLEQQLYLISFKYELEQLESMVLLNMMLTTAMTHQNSEVVLPILEAWNNHLPIYEDVSLFTTLMLYPVVDVGALRFVATSLVNVSFLEVMDELRLLDDSDTTAIACQRALEVFGPQSQEVYQVAYLNAGGTLDPEQAVQNPDNLNQAVLAFLSNLLKPMMAPKPEWVSQDEKPEDIIFQLSPPPIPEQTLTLEEQVDLVTAGLQASGLTLADREESIEAVTAILKSATEEQKMELLRPVLEKEQLDSLQGDRELFRLLGPANPLYDSNNQQLAFGGCRMFSCQLFDYDEENMEYYDWFNGLCDTCHKGIARRQYALRMPIASGGWVGCYCSFQCLRRGIDQREEDNRRPELAIRLMVDNIEQQIKDIGIQDLTPIESYVDPITRPGSGIDPQVVRYTSS